MDPLYLVLYVFVGVILFIQVVARVVRRIHHFLILSFMTQLIDNPLRRRYLQRPGEIADRLELEPGLTVIEVGPGKGSYTLEAARRIAPGTLYACDISEYVVERLRERAMREGVGNVDPRIEDVYGLSFGGGSVDRVFMVACLPEIPDKVRALTELCRVLKPGGLLSTCELLMDPDYPLMRTERRWAAEAGLEPYREYSGLLSYQLVFRKPMPTV